MHDIRLLGLHISVYTRIARLALEEKQVNYRFEEVDVFADDGIYPDYLALNPFGMIPTLVHGELVLYETAAIARYVDEISPGESLQPDLPAARARMNQIIGALDHYGYKPMVWDVYVQRVAVPAGGGDSDERLIASAMPGIRKLLSELSRWRGEQGFLVGDRVTLADLHLYPMLYYFAMTPEGQDLMSEFPRLEHWSTLMETRPSVLATPFHVTATAGDGDSDTRH